MTTFLERTPRQCCAPAADDEPGPDMQVCGERVKPGTSYCETHYRRFYVPLTRETVKAINQTAISSARSQRVTPLLADD